MLIFPARKSTRATSIDPSLVTARDRLQPWQWQNLVTSPPERHKFQVQNTTTAHENAGAAA